MTNGSCLNCPFIRIYLSRKDILSTYCGPENPYNSNSDKTPLFEIVVQMHLADIYVVVDVIVLCLLLLWHLRPGETIMKTKEGPARRLKNITFKERKTKC